MQLYACIHACVWSLIRNVAREFWKNWMTDIILLLSLNKSIFLHARPEFYSMVSHTAEERKEKLKIHIIVTFKRHSRRFNFRGGRYWWPYGYTTSWKLYFMFETSYISSPSNFCPFIRQNENIILYLPKIKQTLYSRLKHELFSSVL